MIHRMSLGGVGISRRHCAAHLSLQRPQRSAASSGQVCINVATTTTGSTRCLLPKESSFWSSTVVTPQERHTIPLAAPYPCSSPLLG